MSQKEEEEGRCCSTRGQHSNEASIYSPPDDAGSVFQLKETLHSLAGKRLAAWRGNINASPASMLVELLARWSKWSAAVPFCTAT